MKIAFDYGHGFMEANLPDDRTDIFIPGETVPDPSRIPEDQLEKETRKSIQNPIGINPIKKLVKKGSKVAIVFPDKVKGGFQRTSHRKTAIPIIIDECFHAGVRKEDIKF